MAMAKSGPLAGPYFAEKYGPHAGQFFGSKKWPALAKFAPPYCLLITLTTLAASL
jgi:hypothetical protein